MEKFSNLSKIRKFIISELSSLGKIEVYTKYWMEMEDSYLEASSALKKSLLESFFTDYLTIQNNGVIPSKENLFMNFVEFFREASRYQDKTIIVKNIYRYSVYYLKIIFADLTDEEIRVKIKKINAFNAIDAYPFLMEVFEDYEFAHINRAMLLEILDTVIGFIEERNSKKPSQIALSFAGLSTEINKMLVLKDYTPHFVVEKDEAPVPLTINSLDIH